MKDSSSGRLRVLLTGLPGSGKTTVAHKISDKYKVGLVKTGELLREMAHGDDEIAHRLQKVMQTGEYADDELVTDVVKKALTSPDCENGFVMDGYPRRLSQLRSFDPGFDYIFYLKISEETAIKRLSNRHRQDDTPEIIKKRLEVFKETMLPLLDHFREQHRLVELDGEPDEQRVFAHIEEFIDDTQK